MATWNEFVAVLDQTIGFGNKVFIERGNPNAVPIDTVVAGSASRVHASFEFAQKSEVYRWYIMRRWYMLNLQCISEFRNEVTRRNGGRNEKTFANHLGSYHVDRPGGSGRFDFRRVDGHRLGFGQGRETDHATR
jgi:hypothetical protein